MNKDGIHRIYIEPIAGSKSRHSKMLKSNSVLPQTHVTSPGVTQNVGDASAEEP